MPLSKIKIVFLFLLGIISIGIAQENKIDAELTRLSGKAYFVKGNKLVETYLETSLKDADTLINILLGKQTISKYPAQLAQSQYLKGRILSTQGDYDASYVVLDKAIVVFDRLKNSHGLAKCYLTKGMVCLYQGKKDDARTFLDKSLRLFTEVDNEQGIGQSLHELGHFHYIFGDDRKALEFYQKALEIQEGLNDKKGISDSYFRMGLAHLSSDRGEALTLLDASRHIKAQIGDQQGLAKVNISLGVMNEEMGNANTAIKYYWESYEANKAVGDKRVNAIIFNNLGVAYADGQKYDSSLVYHKKALTIRQELGQERGIVQSLMNIGEIYQYMENRASALVNLRSAYKLSNGSQTKPMLGGVTGRLGEVFLNGGQLDSADTYFNEQLEIQKKGNNYFNMAETFKNLSKLKEEQGDFKKSLEYHKLYKKIRDSSLQVRGEKELAEVEAKYENEKKQAEIISLQQENDKRTLWRNIFAIGTLVTLAFALLLFQFFIYRNKKNEELLSAKETQHRQLEKLDKMKSRFFSNISHEFRTPLTLILGPLDKIRKNTGNTLQSEVDMIERNGNRLLKLINQLLDLSKIESGKVMLKASFVDVVPLVKGVVMSFNSIAEAKKIKLGVDVKKDSHFVYVDTEKMEEILINLMSNACKYTPKGGKIKMVLEEDKRMNLLKLAISDSGAGIPEQELEHIFDRFYQASNADTENTAGTGIGLSLVKELVELHKGNIQVKSKVGKGTTFEIGLPMGKSHLTEDEIVGIRPPMEIPVTQKEPGSPKENLEVEILQEDTDKPIVLMIEDNADLRTYIRGVLEPHYQILEAVNGKEGLSMANEHIPDLVLSDLMMPKMDGLEFCKRLKEEMLTNHIPVILLTAKSSKEDRLEGLKNLADDYLTKPFSTEELLVRLQNMIQIRKTLRDKFEAEDVLMPKKVQLSSMDSIFMEKVTNQLEAEMSNFLFGVVELAYAVGLSRSQLFRKIKAITNLTPNEYIRSFRLHRALDMLKQQTGSVSEVAYATGFQNPSYFSKVFQEQFGMTPSSLIKT